MLGCAAPVLPGEELGQGISAFLYFLFAPSVNRMVPKGVRKFCLFGSSDTAMLAKTSF